MSGFLENLALPFRYLSAILSPTQTPDMDLSWTTQDENFALYDTLSKPAGKRPALPVELIYQILDHPSRWICGHRSDFPDSSTEDSNSPALQVRANRGDLQMKVIVTSKPLTAHDILNLREVVFTFTSKDQGHSWDRVNHNTYNGSFSWFEVGVMHITAAPRDKDTIREADLKPPDYDRFELQRNRHAGQHPEKYRKEFGLDHEVVRCLKEGDVIELLACAQYPMWSNIVYCAGVEIWKVDNVGN